MSINTETRQPATMSAKENYFLCNDQEGYNGNTEESNWGLEKIRIINFKVLKDDDPKQY